jgi:hypothetical protein
MGKRKTTHASLIVGPLDELSVRTPDGAEHPLGHVRFVSWDPHERTVTLDDFALSNGVTIRSDHGESDVHALVSVRVPGQRARQALEDAAEMLDRKAKRLRALAGGKR